MVRSPSWLFPNLYRPTNRQKIPRTGSRAPRWTRRPIFVTCNSVAWYCDTVPKQGHKINGGSCYLFIVLLGRNRDVASLFSWLLLSQHSCTGTEWFSGAYVAEAPTKSTTRQQKHMRRQWFLRQVHSVANGIGGTYSLMFLSRCARNSARGNDSGVRRLGDSQQDGFCLPLEGQRRKQCNVSVMSTRQETKMLHSSFLNCKVSHVGHQRQVAVASDSSIITSAIYEQLNHQSCERLSRMCRRSSIALFQLPTVPTHSKLTTKKKTHARVCITAMTSWPWMKGVNVAVADPTDPVCPEDVRASVKELIAEHRDTINAV